MITKLTNRQTDRITNLIQWYYMYYIILYCITLYCMKLISETSTMGVQSQVSKIRRRIVCSQCNTVMFTA